MDLNQLMALIKQEYKSFHKIITTSNQSLIDKISEWQLEGKLNDNPESNGRGKKIELILKKNPSLIKSYALLQYPTEIQTIYAIEKLLLKLAFLPNNKYDSIESLQNSFMALSTAYNKETEYYGKVFEYPALLNSIEALGFIKDYDKLTFTIFDLSYSMLKSVNLSTRYLHDSDKENEHSKKTLDLFVSSYKNFIIGIVETLLHEDNKELKYKADKLLDIIYEYNNQKNSDIINNFIDNIYSKYSSNENNEITKELILSAFEKTNTKLQHVKNISQTPRNHDNKPSNKKLVACIGASVFSGKNLPQGKKTVIESLEENILECIENDFGKDGLGIFNKNIDFEFVNFSKSGKGIKYGTEIFTKYPYDKKTKFDAFFFNLVTNDLYQEKSKYYIKETVYNDVEDKEETIDICNAKSIYDLVYDGYKSIIEQVKLHNEPCKIFLAPTVPNTWLFPDNVQTRYQIKSAINKLIAENQDPNYQIIRLEAPVKLLSGPKSKENANGTIWEDGMHIQDHDPISKFVAGEIYKIYKDEVNICINNNKTAVSNKTKSVDVPLSGSNRHRQTLNQQ